MDTQTLSHGKGGGVRVGKVLVLEGQNQLPRCPLLVLINPRNLDDLAGPCILPPRNRPVPAESGHDERVALVEDEIRGEKMGARPNQLAKDAFRGLMCLLIWVLERQKRTRV